MNFSDELTHTCLNTHKHTCIKPNNKQTTQIGQKSLPKIFANEAKESDKSIRKVMTLLQYLSNFFLHFY